ncbi:MAG: hypothetical protein Fur0044_42900 [Anaerolineae bacterium]
MSTPSISEVNVSLPVDPARQLKPKAWFIFPKKAFLAALAIFVLVCANFISLASFWTDTYGKAPEGASGSPIFRRDDFTPPVAQKDSFQDVSQIVFSPPPAPTLASPAVLTPTLTAPAETKIQHVVIISIDGLRPDALLAADAPTLDSLIIAGAYSPNAQTVKISETLPSHASMVSGVIPERHGILWGVPYIGWPGMNGPTMFSVAHEAGLSTAMVFGKDKLHYLALPNSVDQCLGSDTHDPEIRDNAIKVIQAGLPHLMFVHFPDVDRVGHGYGWMSPNQFLAITFVDNLIGELLLELEKGGYLNSTLLIVTSDHGGHGFRHGDDSPIDRTIPWLAVGPGVKQGVTLSSSINTYDTAATVLYALELPIPEDWDGKPVTEIFQ